MSEKALHDWSSTEKPSRRRKIFLRGLIFKTTCKISDNHGCGAETFEPCLELDLHV